MKYKIRKRNVLVLIIAAAQTICLCWGVFVFSAWLRSSVRQIVHDQVLADNVQTAKQMMLLIEQMDVSDLRSNQSSWLRLQSTIREIELPNEGFICVICDDSGELLCHPALREAPSVLQGNIGIQKPGVRKLAMQKPEMQKPGMQKPAMQKPEMQKPGMQKLAMQKPEMQKPEIQKPAMQKPEMQKVAEQSDKKLARNVTQDISGYTIEYHGELQIIAAGYIPELDANVNVHQKASGIEKNIARLTKPVVPIGLAVSLVLVVTTTGLIIGILRRYDNRLAALNENLEDMVDQRTQTLRKTRDAVVFGLAKLAESRDTDTGQHLERIRTYVTLLANHLSRQLHWIDTSYIENLALASSLHDIGKVAIPDQILLKPGRFIPEERTIMETHALQGGECLEAISQHLGEDDFLQLSREIAFTHHEKWDGTGYPFQIAGEKIPLAGRIVALADVYDALRSRRPYKEPMSHEKAKAIILEGRGSHFDPQIVDAFIKCESDFIEFSEKYAEVSPATAVIETQPELVPI